MARALFRSLSHGILRSSPNPNPNPSPGALRQSLLLPSPMLSWRRAFSEAKIFVGGLSFRTTEDGLRDAFAVHGEVSDVRIITDRETGRSRGFGFVTYYNESDAETALSKLQGHNLDGRAIRVDRASARPPPSRAGGFGGGGGGAVGGFGSLNEPPEPAADEADWGSIPPLNADIPFDNNNTSSSSS